MKKVLLICGLLFILITSSLWAEYFYVRTFSADVGPGPIAVSQNPTTTDCYYATFASATSNIYYVPDFLTSVDSTDQRLIAGPFVFVASRGFQGIALDSADNVFISGDNGGGSPVGIFLKYAPNVGKTVWTQDATFNPDNTVRYAGCALLNDSIIVASITVASPKALSTSNGASLIDFPTDTYYGRKPTFNPDNNDIYQGFNGSGVGTNTFEIYINGDPSNLGNYTLDATTLFADSIGLVARNHNAYDELNHQLLHIDTQNKMLEIYDVNTTLRGAASINTTPVQTIDLALIAAGTSPFDVVHTQVDGIDYILVADYGLGVDQIYVFGPPPTKATTWMVY